MCVSCNEPIIPAPGSEETVRVVALDKNFHLKCYRCEVRPIHSCFCLGFFVVVFYVCHRVFQLLIINISITLQDCARPLSIEADENGCYPLDGKILCMKCHTQRAKQAAHWLAKAASLSVTMNQIQKHRIHPAADFLPLRQGFVQYMCAGVWVNVQREYVCLHADKV